MSAKLPKYRKHNTGKAFAEYQKKRVYFPGWHNEPESVAAYREFIRKVVGGIPVYDVAPAVECIAELGDAFLTWAESYYSDPRGTVLNLTVAVKRFADQYGRLHVQEFGPKLLKEWQQILAKKGLTRDYINDCVRRVRQMFKWGVSEELVPETIYRALMTVPGLKQGRTAAKESTPRRMIEWKQVRPVLRHLSRQLRTMVLLHWLLGCRSRSLCLMKPEQINRESAPWRWKPRHKMEYAGKELTLYLGPKARRILAPLLESTPPKSYVFSPRAMRKNKRYGRFYSSKSYRQAVERGIARANAARAIADADLPEDQRRKPIERWTPHRIRHSKSTLTREKHGLEAAQAVIGHESIEAIQIYAERRSKDAKRIAELEG